METTEPAIEASAEPPPEVRTYTTAQVAKILHLNVAQVRYLINDGQLGHLAVSTRQFIVGHDQLMAFLEERRQDARR